MKPELSFTWWCLFRKHRALGLLPSTSVVAQTYSPTARRWEGETRGSRSSNFGCVRNLVQNKTKPQPKSDDILSIRTWSRCLCLESLLLHFIFPFPRSP